MYSLGVLYVLRCWVGKGRCYDELCYDETERRSAGDGNTGTIPYKIAFIEIMELTFVVSVGWRSLVGWGRAQRRGR